MKPPLIAGLAPALLALALSCATAQAANPLADTFTQWRNDHWISRSYKLRELGFLQPIVLANITQQRELYLPVPPGLPLRDASLWLDGHYMLAEKGRTTLAVFTEDTPVAARALTDDYGVLRAQIGIDGLPRASGFVRVGLTWTSVLTVPVCTDGRVPGNSIHF